MTSSAFSIGDGQTSVSAFERAGQRQVAPAADDEGRLRDEPPRGRRKAVEAVLADADDGEPAFPAHGAAP